MLWVTLVVHGLWNNPSITGYFIISYIYKTRGPFFIAHMFVGFRKMGRGGSWVCWMSVAWRPTFFGGGVDKRQFMGQISLPFASLGDKQVHSIIPKPRGKPLNHGGNPCCYTTISRGSFGFWVPSLKLTCSHPKKTFKIKEIQNLETHPSLGANSLFLLGLW